VRVRLAALRPMPVLLPLPRATAGIVRPCLADSYRYIGMVPCERLVIVRAPSQGQRLPAGFVKQALKCQISSATDH
jgi:hypothetical protein